jgi:hypothetical protein
MSRSGSPYAAPTDADRRPTLIGVSTVDGITPVPLEVNPVTFRLLVDAIANLNPAAGGGWKPFFVNNLTTTVTVSSVAGKFGGYMIINLNSAPAYIQVFDTVGAVTLGTTVPTFVLTLPSNATPANGIAANMEPANGILMANGIKIAATTTASGATTVSTGINGSIFYV